MSNQESMFSPPESTPPPSERTYNTDPREQHSSAQQAYQEPLHSENSYEEGYQGYNISYAQFQQGEKLRPKTTTLQGRQVFILVLIIALILMSGWALSGILNIIFSIISTFTFLAFVGIACAAIFATKPIPLPSRTFSVSENPVLFVHNDAGAIRVWHSETNLVEVRGTMHVSRLFDKHTEIPLDCTQNGNTININIKHWSTWGLFNARHVSLDIFIPDASDIKLESNAGELRFTGINGYINARTNAGTLHVEQTTLTRGSELRTNAGTIQIRQAILDTDTSFHTNAGTIQIEQSKLKTTNFSTNAGAIHIEQTSLEGGAHFNSNAGTIHFDGSIAPHGNYRFKTNAGSIHVAIPSTSSFTLDGHTNMGTIHNEFNDRVVGPQPHALLSLRSDMGVIHIQRK